MYAGNEILRPRLDDDQCLDRDADTDQDEDTTRRDCDGIAPRSLCERTMFLCRCNAEADAASLP